MVKKGKKKQDKYNIWQNEDISKVFINVKQWTKDDDEHNSGYSICVTVGKKMMKLFDKSLKVIQKPLENIKPETFETSKGFSHEIFNYIEKIFVHKLRKYFDEGVSGQYTNLKYFLISDNFCFFSIYFKTF